MAVELVHPLSYPIRREAGASPDYKIQTPHEFLTHFTKSAQVAKKRVWFRTMYFENDETFGQVSDVLIDAAKRKLDSRFITDYFTFMFTDGHVNWMPTLDPRRGAELRRKQQAKHQAIAEMREAGVEVIITNVPGVKEKILPIRGRSHIKGARVDDEAWGGGLNASDKDFRRTDTMLYTHDPVAVEALSEQFEVDNTRREERVNRLIPISAATSMLIDGGVPGRSVILDEAYDFVQGATNNITLVSQFFPDKPMLDRLAEAQKRNVTVKAITSDPRYIHEVLARIYSQRTELFSRMRRQPVPIEYVPDWVHIKALVGDIGTDHPWVVYGTHNFLQLGVKLGTEEYALSSRDPKIVHEVNSAVNLLV